MRVGSKVARFDFIESRSVQNRSECTGRLFERSGFLNAGVYARPRDPATIIDVEGRLFGKVGFLESPVLAITLEPNQVVTAAVFLESGGSLEGPVETTKQEVPVHGVQAFGRLGEKRGRSKGHFRAWGSRTVSGYLQDSSYASGHVFVTFIDKIRTKFVGPLPDIEIIFPVQIGTEPPWPDFRGDLLFPPQVHMESPRLDAELDLWWPPQAWIEFPRPDVELDLWWPPQVWTESSRPDIQVDVDTYFVANPVMTRPGIELDIDAHFTASPVMARPDTRVDVTIYFVTDPVMTRPDIELDIDAHFTASPVMARPDTQVEILYYETIVMVSAEFVQSPGVLLGACLTFIELEVDLIEPPGTVKMRDGSSLKGCKMIIPDDTLEKPNFYRPHSKPPGFLHVDGSHPLTQGLSFYMASSDARLKKYSDSQPAAARPGDVITDRGLTFSFNGVDSGIRFHEENLFKENHDYALFMIFKSRPPCEHIDIKQSYLFHTAWGFNTGFHVLWDFQKGSWASRTATARIRNLNDSRDIPLGLPATSDLNASPAWYVLGYSSSQYAGTQTYLYGLPGSKLDNLYPKVKDVPRTLDFGRLHGVPIVTNYIPWKGELLVFYEWSRVLSDAEHASLALDPFQFFDATSSHE